MLCPAIQGCLLPAPPVPRARLAPVPLTPCYRPRRNRRTRTAASESGDAVTEADAAAIRDEPHLPATQTAVSKGGQDGNDITDAALAIALVRGIAFLAVLIGGSAGGTAHAAEYSAESSSGGETERVQTVPSSRHSGAHSAQLGAAPLWQSPIPLQIQPWHPIPWDHIPQYPGKLCPGNLCPSNRYAHNYTPVIHNQTV